MENIWILKTITGNNDTKYLYDNEKYTVGRKNANIIIANDESVSRIHGELEVENNTVFFTDKGSKFGTFVNKEKLSHQKRTQLNAGTIIRFGLLQSEFKIEKLRFFILSSRLNESDKKALMEPFDYLNAEHVTNWSPKCTHLVVSELILTSKVLCALVSEQAIVNALYFFKCVQSIKDGEPLPKPEDYTPELNDNFLNKNIKLERNPARKTLFADKVFIFLVKRTHHEMFTLITLTGGTSQWWSDSINITDADICQNPNRYIFIEEDLTDFDKTSKAYKTFYSCTDMLKTLYHLRSIPFQEIPLAIINASAERYCNTKFNRAALIRIADPPLLSSEVLACETPSLEETQLKSPVVVEASYESNTDTNESGDRLKRLLDSCEESIREIESNAKRMKVVEPDIREAQVEISTMKPTTTTAAAKTTITTRSVMKSQSDSSTASSSKTNSTVLEFVENPFSRKRKATQLLQYASKRATPGKIVEEPKREILSDTTNETVKRHVSFLELSEGIRTEVKEEYDEENQKYMNKFNDSIKIEFAPIVIKDRTITGNSSDDNNTATTTTIKGNFKKFKKIRKMKQQTDIVPISSMDVIVIGKDTISTQPEEQIQSFRDDDNNDDFVEVQPNRSSWRRR